MSGDVVARAIAALAGVSDGPWMAGKGGSGYSNWVDSRPDLVNISIADRIDILADAEFIAAARSLVPELVAEVEALREVAAELRKRTCKSLPPGMVWQDYYSPDDVLKIRQPLDDELEHLRGLQLDDRANAIAAIEERDAANAEVEKLRGALETIRDLASTASFDPLSGLLDILAVIESAGAES